MVVLAAGCAGKEPAELDVREQRVLLAKVVSVVDGDTVHVVLENGAREKVRFIGVNAPEATKEQEPFGLQAAAYTKQRLEGQKIWLETDVEKRDRYGRLLAYVWLDPPREGNDREARENMFNAELLLKGYAQVMTVPPNVKYADFFVACQREARETDQGLWGLADGRKAEDYYVASNRSKKFHRPDCRWGREIAPQNLRKFATVDEALDAGYEPCRECRP